MGFKSKLKKLRSRAHGNPGVAPLIYTKQLQRSFETPSVTGGSIYGKTVMITGGSGGIGRAMAVRFLAEGCRVVITGRNEKKLKKTVDDIKERNNSYEITFEVMDQCDESDIRRISEKWFATKKVNILINNAGIFTDIDRRGRFVSVSIEDFLKIWDTNFEGMKNLTLLYAEQMHDTRGKIINIASICADFPRFQFTPYGLSKASVIGFSEEIRKTYPNLKVQVIEPGSVATDMGYLGIGKDISRYESNTLNHVIIPEQIAALAAFLASDVGNYVSNNTVIAAAGEIL